MLFALTWSLNAPALAAELNVDTSLTGRVEYNDNVALRFVPAESWRFLIEPGLTASRRTESSLLSARLRLGFNRYSNPMVADATDKAATLAATQSFERSRLGIVVDYSEVSSQSATVLGQTGINVGRRQVHSLLVTPTWTYSLTSRLSLNASAGYTGTRFEQGNVASVTDYTTETASVGLTRALDDRTSASLSVSYLKFDTVPFVSRSESWSGNASLEYAFTSTLSGSATLGLQRVVTNQAQTIRICPVDPSFCLIGLVQPVSVGIVGQSTQKLIPFNFNLRWQVNERDTASVAFVQRVNPSGAGALTAGFQASAAFARALSPLSDISISSNYVRSRTLGGTGIGDVLTIGPTLNWRLSEAWTTSAGYIFTRLTYPNLNRNVESNALFASVTYGWPTWNAFY